jgi:hypothetical protein
LVEGGYSNHKNDRGGKTKYGITQAVAKNYGIEDLTIEQAKEIYYKKYYLKNKLDKVDNVKIALSIFDFVVNSGLYGIRKAQQALKELGYKITIDGVIGEQTLKYLNLVNENKFLAKYHELQIKFYNTLANSKTSQKVFLKGWLNRVNSKIKYIKEMK